MASLLLPKCQPLLFPLKNSLLFRWLILFLYSFFFYSSSPLCSLFSPFCLSFVSFLPLFFTEEKMRAPIHKSSMAIYSQDCCMNLLLACCMKLGWWGKCRRLANRSMDVAGVLELPAVLLKTWVVHGVLELPAVLLSTWAVRWWSLSVGKGKPSKLAMQVGDFWLASLLIG